MMHSMLAMFDTSIYNSYYMYVSFFWGFLPMLIFFPNKYWMLSYHPLYYWTKKMTKYHVMRSSGGPYKSFHPLMTSLFMLILTINLWGTLPYSISFSSHMMFTFSMSMLIWTSLIMGSISWGAKPLTTKFLPEKAPNTITFLLIPIELLSSMIRPITLSFRLAANMSSGHVILSLFSSLPPLLLLQTSLSLSLLLLLLISFYIMFEWMICFIQSFVFFLLSVMYTNDHWLSKYSVQYYPT